ncbi:3-isopropylmalate dehydratase small subunit [Streptomyces sp. NPDC044780]|uniref:3-isopropylmalate dehydratase small subunit n=1 Tax=unclassified Streptomyces TaxID=2593676 RepID=UPI0033E23999
MQPLTVYTGSAVPLRRSNVDTDQIIPARYCLTVSRTGFADHLFHTWRQDPDFVLNRPEYTHASVLLAGPDFGTGSSREHAVWALQDFGFRVVVSARFGDIFRGNATKSGLLPAQLDEDAVLALQQRVEADPALPVTLDVIERRVRCAELDLPLEIDDFTRRRFLEGLDDIDLTLRHAAAITAYEAGRPAGLPAVLA